MLQWRSLALGRPHAALGEVDLPLGRQGVASILEIPRRVETKPDRTAADHNVSVEQGNTLGERKPPEPG